MRPKGNNDPKDGKNANNPKPGDEQNKGGFRDYQPGEDDFDDDFKGAGDGLADDEFDEFSEDDDDYDDDLDGEEESQRYEETSSGYPRRGRRAHHLVASQLSGLLTNSTSRRDHWLQAGNSISSRLSLKRMRVNPNQPGRNLPGGRPAR